MAPRGEARLVEDLRDFLDDFAFRAKRLAAPLLRPFRPSAESVAVDDAELDMLKAKLRRIRATLRAAEDRVVADDFVALWLRELGTWRTRRRTSWRSSSSRPSGRRASRGSRPAPPVQRRRRRQAEARDQPDVLLLPGPPLPQDRQDHGALQRDRAGQGRAPAEERRWGEAAGGQPHDAHQLLHEMPAPW